MQQEYILKKEFKHLYDEEFHGLKGTIDVFQALNIPVAHIIEDVRIEMKLESTKTIHIVKDVKLESTNTIHIHIVVNADNKKMFANDFVERHQLYELIKQNLETF
jgi:radical SAM superfamily enzyme